jgi:SIR2-like domain
VASSASIKDLNASRLSAEEALAQHLFDGSLTLFLGAGVSSDAKLPGWDALVLKLIEETKVEPASVRSDKLKAVDDILRLSRTPVAGLPNLIRPGLYSPAMLERGDYPETAYLAPLANALVNLTAGTVRGRISQIFTLNFDDLIESILWDRGFRCQTVTDFPDLFDERVDVRVMHLHGFVPLRAGKSSPGDIVLSYQQYRNRLGSGHPWHDLLRSTVLSKILLFVGVSFDDLEMDAIFASCFKSLKETRPIGFAIMRNPNDGVRAQLADAGIVTVAVAEYADIPDLLRNLARQAGLLV